MYGRLSLRANPANGYGVVHFGISISYRRDYSSGGNDTQQERNEKTSAETDGTEREGGLSIH